MKFSASKVLRNHYPRERGDRKRILSVFPKGMERMIFFRFAPLSQVSAVIDFLSTVYDGESSLPSPTYQ